LVGKKTPGRRTNMPDHGQKQLCPTKEKNMGEPVANHAEGELLDDQNRMSFAEENRETWDREGNRGKKSEGPGEDAAKSGRYSRNKFRGSGKVRPLLKRCLTKRGE